MSNSQLEHLEKKVTALNKDYPEVKFTFGFSLYEGWYVIYKGVKIHHLSSEQLLDLAHAIDTTERTYQKIILS